MLVAFPSWKSLTWVTFSGGVNDQFRHMASPSKAATLKVLPPSSNSAMIGVTLLEARWAVRTPVTGAVYAAAREERTKRARAGGGCMGRLARISRRGRVMITLGDAPSSSSFPATLP